MAAFMRTFIVYLAIAALLLCPYNCAVKWNSANGAQNDGQRACCDKCLARETSNAAIPAHDQSPKHPEPDEDGRCCLCEGAVFNAAAQSWHVTSLQAFLWTWVIDPTEPQGLTSLTATATCDSMPPALAGGLSARIAICSLVL